MDSSQLKSFNELTNLSSGIVDLTILTTDSSQIEMSLSLFPNLRSLNLGFIIRYLNYD